MFSTQDPFTAQTTALLQHDVFRLRCLQAVRSLALPDWYIAAGFVRNAIWDAAHQLPMTPLQDIDVVYFDAQDLSTDREAEAEAQLNVLFPEQRFEVRNQARMHVKHGHAPYQNCADGIRRWVEQATCIAVRLTEHNQLELYAPFGLALNWSLHVSMNPKFPQPEVFCQRVLAKRGWYCGRSYTWLGPLCIPSVKRAMTIVGNTNALWCSIGTHSSRRRRKKRQEAFFQVVKGEAQLKPRAQHQVKLGVGLTAGV